MLIATYISPFFFNIPPYLKCYYARNPQVVQTTYSGEVTLKELKVVSVHIIVVFDLDTSTFIGVRFLCWMDERYTHVR